MFFCASGMAFLRALRAAAAALSAVVLAGVLVPSAGAPEVDTAAVEGQPKGMYFYVSSPVCMFVVVVVVFYLTYFCC